MGYANTTPQFGLPQYAPADMPQREDFNKAFKIISENMGKGGNDNLLDNWYFADPIDQRGGYVTLPNVPYYRADGTQAGTTSTYHTVIGKSSNGNSIIEINGELYFVSYLYVVRGYVGAGYGIDRWFNGGEKTVLCVNEDYITLIQTGDVEANAWHGQFIENPQRFKGCRVTASVMYRTSSACGFQCYSPEGTAAKALPTTDGKWNVFSLSFVMPNDVTQFRPTVIISKVAGTIDMKAMKLELGDKQNLAHQDENGNWVLNDPPPNKQQELAKCQRYFEVIEHTLCEAVSTTRLQGIRYRTRKRAVPNIKFFPYKSASPFYDTNESGYVSKQSDGSKVAVTGVTLSTEDGFGQVSGTFVKGDYYYVSAYVDANL